MIDPIPNNYDNEDVPAALARITADGHGATEPGEPDFVSFADPAAEIKTEDTK